jgi:hypothetical protein
VIKNGRATGIDGGIYNTGTLALTNSTASSTPTARRCISRWLARRPRFTDHTIIAGNTAGTPMRVCVQRPRL